MGPGVAERSRGHLAAYDVLQTGSAMHVSWRSKHTLDLMRAGGILVVVHVSEELEQAAWTVFERFNQDKEWSFTDCTSKMVMDHLGVRQVFAFDQMGFLRRP